MSDEPQRLHKQFESWVFIAYITCVTAGTMFVAALETEFSKTSEREL